jgi:subtilisin family serine protease
MNTPFSLGDVGQQPLAVPAEKYLHSWSGGLESQSPLALSALVSGFDLAADLAGLGFAPEKASDQPALFGSSAVDSPLAADFGLDQPKEKAGLGDGGSSGGDVLIGPWAAAAGEQVVAASPDAIDLAEGLAVAPSVVPDLAGNTLATARTISSLGAAQVFSDWVGSTDTNDYYRFSLAQAGNFNLSLSGLSADADVQLLSSSGSVLASSARGGSMAESIIRSLTAGNYFVRVYPYSGSTNYTLSLSATPSTPADNAGNTLATARSIGALSAAQSFSDWVGSADTNDYYSFSLSQASNFNLSLSGLSADADVQLLSSSGSVLASSTRGGTVSETIGTSLNVGSYYVRVFPYSGSTNYTLTLSASANSTPSGFSSINGYGEASAERAIERLLNITIPDLPNQFTGGLYGLDRIGAPEAWSRGYTGQGIVVAVCDTGVDRTHPDLDGNIWTNAREVVGNGLDDDGNGFVDDVYGWNFASGNNNTLDVQGHGTHVAGTIAGENNGFGVTGVAYAARIMPVKVLGDNGSGSFQSVASGIRYAADNGAHVINLSLGASVGDSSVQSAVQYAWNRGVAVIMAAGNNGASRPGYPASYATNWGIAVGAIDSNGSLASFSNRAGTTVLDYVTAAGVNVYSTLPGNRYASYNGTSMATPNVAGAMALLMQANRASGRNLSIAQLEQLLTSTASNFGTSSAGSGTTSSGSPGALVAATDLGGSPAAPVESAPGSVQAAPDAGLPASSPVGADATSTPAVLASNFAQAGSSPTPGPSMGSSELGRDVAAVESASTTATGGSHSSSNPGQAVTMPLGVFTGRSRAGRSGPLDPLTGLLPSHWRSA